MIDNKPRTEPERKRAPDAQRIAYAKEVVAKAGGLENLLGKLDEMTALAMCQYSPAGTLKVLRDMRAVIDVARSSESNAMKECRHCGWMCAPNTGTPERVWYPLEQSA
jgi:hypothetical protein